MMVNKRQQPIEVLSYNADWPRQFLDEACLLKDIFAQIFVDIHHIGSTAIPGMVAKPTIDILLVVRDIKAVDNYNHDMAAIGYEAWGEYGINGRRFFVKGDEKRTHHVHTFAQHSEHIGRHLFFRDYMMTHPEIAMQYQDLKLKLAQRYANDRRAYVLNKQDFVKYIEAKAIAWAENNE